MEKEEDEESMKNEEEEDTSGRTKGDEIRVMEDGDAGDNSNIDR